MLGFINKIGGGGSDKEKEEETEEKQKEEETEVANGNESKPAIVSSAAVNENDDLWV